MIWRFFRRAHWDRERAEELQSYLDIETEENMARGMSADDARHAAQRKLGSTVGIREDIYDMNTLRPLASLWRDLRLVGRVVRRRPGFAATVIATLALGIGANTAIFSVVDAVLVRPLPYPDEDRLVSLRHVAPGFQPGEMAASPTLYFTYRDESRVFEHVGLWGAGGQSITGLNRRVRCSSPRGFCKRSASSPASAAGSPKPTRWRRKTGWSHSSSPMASGSGGLVVTPR